MKTAKVKLFIAALAIVMFPALAFAAPEMAFISPVTIKLQSDQTVQVLSAKDDDGKTIKPKEMVWENEWMTNKGVFAEAKGKFQTTKIGNKEILEWLFDAQIIDAVKGAQIMLISGEGFDLVVEEADGDIVDISMYFAFDQAGPDIYEFDLKEEDTDKNGGKEEISETMKMPIAIEFQLGERYAYLTGIMELSMARSASEKKMEEKYEFNGGDIDPLGGYLVDDNLDNATECLENDCWGLVEGSIKIGKGKEFEELL